MKNLIIITFLFLSFSCYSQIKIDQVSLIPIENSIFSAEEQKILPEGIKSITPINIINEQNLLELDQIDLVLPDKYHLLLRKDKSQSQYTNEDNVWAGESSDGTDVFLFYEKTGISGHIKTKNEVYEIQRFKDGKYYFIEYNMDELRTYSCLSHEMDSIHIVNSNEPISKSESSISIVNGEERTHFVPTIRILVLFTNSAAATGLNIEFMVNTARQQWITAAYNSSLVPTIEITDVQQTLFTETLNSSGNVFEDVNSDLERLINNIGIQQLRNEQEADVVVLVTNADYPGILGSVFDIETSDENAYAIAQVNNLTSTYTFIHEVAHLFGARHEFTADNTPVDAHGHKWNTGFFGSNKWGSIMKTLEQNRTRVLHFSNPNRTHNGKATGENDAYNVEQMINYGPTIASFRDLNQNNFNVGITGPASANQGDLLYFSSSFTGGQTPISYQWQIDNGGGFTNYSTNNTISIIMPAGDLQVRLTATDANNQTDTDNHIVSNEYLGGGCTICPDQFDLFYEDENSEKILIYPNPVSNIMFIKGTLSQEVLEIKIYDMDGKELMKIDKNEIDNFTGEIKIDTSNLSEGNYFLKIETNNRSEVFKFSK
jgi:hypothetical protein